MLNVTLRVLDGADRGRVFKELPPPVTIGREEGNSVQLNDERVSRYHVKIQDDHDRLVLTDLESTNGTKINGEDIQLRILRHGDMITLGRSVLLYGSREEISARLAKLRGKGRAGAGTLEPEQVPGSPRSSSYDFELNFAKAGELQATLHELEPPDLPERMSPGQAAQLAELLEYFHIRIRSLVSSVHCEAKSECVVIEPLEWQNLLDLHARLAEYLRQVGDPDQRQA